MAATKITPKQIVGTGANTNDVLAFNGTDWTPTAPSGGGSSSGIAGAVQISGGSGTFSSDATNFFFDDTTNQLQLTGGTSYGIRIQGQNGGVDASASSAVTGAFTPFRSNTNATGSVNLNLTNSNTSSATAHTVLTLSTSVGGGDPFVKLNTAEIGYVIGVDNSGSDKLFIGLGTDPSTMSSANITISSINTGISQTTPTAKLHISGGTATANTAPIKIDSGTALTTPEDGAIEYHGSHLYFTIGSTRYQLDQQASSLTDGDYGDITVSSGGTVWTIDALAVTNAKINDVSFAKITNGTLAANLTGTMVNSGVLVFNYNSGSSALFLDDANSTASMFSEDGTQYVSTSNTSVAIGSGTTQMEYIDGVLRLYDSDITQYVGLTVPATGSLTTSYTLTLPTTDGNANEVLKTDGSGVLSWTTAGNVTQTGTETLTNKRIDPRVVSIASSSTPTPNADVTDIYLITALAAGATFGSPTGTHVQGQKLMYRIKDNGTARALSYNAVFRAVGVTLPTTTIISKTLYLGCIYNATDTKWDIIAVAMEP